MLLHVTSVRKQAKIGMLAVDITIACPSVEKAELFYGRLHIK